MTSKFVPRRALRETVGLYWGSGVADEVPALAWFLLSALAPLALGLTALATVLLGDYREAQALAARAARVLPRDVQDQVVQLILRTRQSSPLLIGLAVIGMVWTSAGAVGVVGRCLRSMLALPPHGVVVGKLRHLALAGALSVVIVLMVLAATTATGLARRIDVDATLAAIAAPVIALGLTVLICAVLYRALAGGALDWRHALGGAALGGLVLQLTPTVAGYYLSLVADRTPVGVFLVLAGVLFTCYVASFGLLLGTAVAARLQRGRPLPAGSPAETAADDSGGVTVVVVARVPERGGEDYRRYERAVLPLLPDHGGRLLRRLTSEDGGIEVHLLSFPSAAALSSYRSDARRAQHNGLLESCGARIEVLEVTDAPIDELLASSVAEAQAAPDVRSRVNR